MSLREVRILAEHEGQLRLVCKFSFTDNDFSVYLIPYAKLGRHFFGADLFEEHEIERTFDFSEQMRSDSAPHLSIHESGQVSISDAELRAGPLQIPPLADLRGQHAATITADSFDGLPLFSGELKSTAQAVDHVIGVESGMESGRLAMYVNGSEPSFDCECGVKFRLTRPGRPRPLNVGIAPVAQQPLGDPGRRGVTVISGWVPDLPEASRSHFLFLRGI